MYEGEEKKKDEKKERKRENCNKESNGWLVGILRLKCSQTRSMR